MTDRTVLDKAMSVWFDPDPSDRSHVRKELRAISIDPDVPFEKFRHALEVGLTVVETPERAAAMTDEARALLNEEAERIDRWLRWGERVEAIQSPPEGRTTEWYAGWHWAMAEIEAGT